MDNAISTIAGKEGFVSDTWRELMVSFSDAVGLADAYRASLDAVYGALQTVVDWLQKINENPVYKAIFAGVIVGTLTAIATTIISVLIPALAAVIAKLGIIATLQATINPTKAIAGLAVGLVGAVATMTALADKAKETADQLQKAQNSVKGLVDAINREIEEFNKPINATLSLADSIVGDSNSAINKMKELQEQKAKIDKLLETPTKMVLNFSTEDQKKLEDLRKQRYGVKHKQELLQEQNEIQWKMEAGGYGNVGDKTYTDAQNRLKTITSLLPTWTGTLIQLDKAITEMESDHTQIVSLTKEEMKNLQDASNILYEQLNPLTDFQRILADSLGLSSDMAEKLKFIKDENGNIVGVKSVPQWVNDYLDKFKQVNTLTKEQRTMLEKAHITLPTELEEATELYTKAQKALEEVVKNPNFCASVDNETIKQLTALVNEYRKRIEDLGGNVDNVATQNTGGNSTGDFFGDIGRQLASGNTYTSAAYSSFTSTMEQTGNAFFAVISVLLSLVMQLKDKSAEWKQADDLLEEQMQQFMPLVMAFGDHLLACEEAVQPLVDAFEQVFRIVGALLRGFNAVIRCLGNVFKIFNIITNLLEPIADFLESIFGTGEELDEEQQTELERLKALNQAYKSLKQAIEEQEEYYLKKRREVNADYYNGILENTTYQSPNKVNDMILTPQGVFNTHPEDTIIAMKHPENMIGNNATSPIIKMSVNIQNNASDVVTANVEETQDEDGLPQLIVQISRQVAGDYASGNNGWDGAYSAREQRTQGRRIVT